MNTLKTLDTILSFNEEYSLAPQSPQTLLSTFCAKSKRVAHLFSDYCTTRKLTIKFIWASTCSVVAPPPQTELAIGEDLAAVGAHKPQLAKAAVTLERLRRRPALSPRRRCLSSLLTLASPLPEEARGTPARSGDHVPTQADGSRLPQPCRLQLQRWDDGRVAWSRRRLLPQRPHRASTPDPRGSGLPRGLQARLLRTSAYLGVPLPSPGAVSGRGLVWEASLPPPAFAWLLWAPAQLQTPPPRHPARCTPSAFCTQKGPCWFFCIFPRRSSWEPALWALALGRKRPVLRNSSPHSLSVGSWGRRRSGEGQN